MESTWVITADSVGARLLERNRDSKDGYTLVDELFHPEGRLREADLVSDRPGRVSDRAAFGRHAGAPPESAHDHEVSGFARDLASKLEQARVAGRFSRLVLAAEPRFLGLLRGALDSNTARCVIGVVPKNLQRTALSELSGRLSVEA